MSKIALFMTIIATLLPGSKTVIAQADYPQPTDKYINDHAEALEPNDEQALRAVLSDLDLQSGIEATVLTIHSIHDYDTGDATMESFATNLFNAWGIGDKKKNDGVLILVAIDDKKVRIELGSGYGSQLDQAMQRVIDEEILPRFRQGDYDRGIDEGVRAIINAITQGPELSPGGDEYTARDAWLGLLGGLIASGLLVIVAYKATRRPPDRLGGRAKRRRAKRRNSSDHWRNWHGGSGSSGGSDSFGGGSSDGGGASGEW